MGNGLAMIEMIAFSLCNIYIFMQAHFLVISLFHVVCSTVSVFSASIFHLVMLTFPSIVVG